MRVDIVTLFPQMIVDAAAYGITGRAIKRRLLTLTTWNPRDYTNDRHRTVDGRPYGGGPGMVMMVEPLRRCIDAARQQESVDTKTIYLSPQGKRLDQSALLSFTKCPRIILVAGRYEGVDERLIEFDIDEEWSIGDYVLSGGELAALVVLDAVTRLLPGALGDEESAQQESFMSGFLDHPHYTRPSEIAGLKVPEVLLSGDHKEIQHWRHQQALSRTALRRPDLLNHCVLSQEDRELLGELKRDSAADAED